MLQRFSVVMGNFLFISTLLFRSLHTLGLVISALADQVKHLSMVSKDSVFCLICRLFQLVFVRCF